MENWKKYRKKPIIVEARKIEEEKVEIETREGKVMGYKGDFIIRGVEGEEYPCGKDIFKKTYEEVDIA